MVRLDRITMQGFKSFAGKVSIPFPSNFCAICGPNGSGKSNIVDAITFVLGTSSARHIRAQKLQNLLFNGGKNKKPADYCIVSMYLDNSDGKIPNQPEEIKITRKITRSGVSIYKLNGKTVTRSKILDVLSNASLSPDGHNIIMQGDVTRIIEMSNQERREIIDEISGISEFDEKKQKAEKELQAVDERVREMMVMVTEKERTVERLKHEKEVAEKYNKLSKQLRKAKATLIHRRLKKAKEEKKRLEIEIEDKTEEFEKIDKEFQEIEKTNEKNEKRLKEINSIIIERSRDYQISKKINELETKITLNKDKLERNKEEIRRLKEADENPVIKSILNLKKEGIYGKFSDLISYPSKYSVAINVAVGNHKNDIVVENDEIASECIKYLKRNKIGRARFIPLNKIKGDEVKAPQDATKAIDLVKFDDKFLPAVKYVLGSTLIVDDIDTARKMKARTVTLDGDLKEASWVMIGGFYKRKADNKKRIAELKEENERLLKEIKDMQTQIKDLQSQKISETEEIKKLQNEKDSLEKKIEENRKKFKDLYNKRSSLLSEISNLKIEKAKIETNLENLETENKEYKDIKSYFDLSDDELEAKIKELTYEINSLGPVNMKALEEYETMSTEFKELRKKLDKLIEEKNAIEKTVAEIEKKRYEKFMETFNEISKNFSKIYADLMGGTAKLRLEEEGNIESGLLIEASPPGKKILDLDAMSGGEKTMTSLAFLFAIMQFYAAPFYILDEVDAALDKVNTKKVDELLKKYSKNVQFIVITHNDTTIASADKVFGVSMEDGVSKVFGIDMPEE